MGPQAGGGAPVDSIACFLQGLWFWVGYGLVFCGAVGFGRSAFAVVPLILNVGSRLVFVSALCAPRGGGFVFLTWSAFGVGRPRGVGFGPLVSVAFGGFVLAPSLCGALCWSTREAKYPKTKLEPQHQTHTNSRN